jgi:hypothetical protein
MHQTDKAKNKPGVSFTIDGVEYTSGDRRQPAGDLLKLAGVDPSDHDLARVVGQSVEKAFKDEDEVQLTPGARFISVFRGPTPVV